MMFFPLCLTYSILLCFHPSQDLQVRIISGCNNLRPVLVRQDYDFD
jgi:hypothetical protein